MRQPVKFRYVLDFVEFFVMFKGIKVIVMRAKLDTADFNEFRRLHRIAQGEAVNLLSDLRRAA